MAIEKTVSEIAEILGVSRQAVNNRVKALAPEDTQKNEKGVGNFFFPTPFKFTYQKWQQSPEERPLPGRPMKLPHQWRCELTCQKCPVA